MGTPQGEVDLEVVFGRAFLVALQRGNMENARVFAQAFLLQRFPDPTLS